MRLSLHTTLLALAFANTLVDPVDAVPVHAAKRHLKRGTGGFHQSALRHSAGLARDLRVALRGLGVGSPARLAVDDDSGSGIYCVPVPDGDRSPSNTNHTHTAHSSPVATTTNKHPSTVTSSSTPSSTAKSNFQLAESYVRVKKLFRVPPARQFFFFFLCLRSPGTRFSRDGTSSRVPTLPMEM